MAPKRLTKTKKHVLKYPPHWITPEDLLTFVELKPFSKKWDNFGLTDQDLSLVQMLIMLEPKKCPVIEGTNGLRKMRCGKKKDGQGKSDGYRVCYVYFEEFLVVLLVIIYSKHEMDDISEAHKKAYATAIERMKTALVTNPKRFGRRKPSRE